MAAKLVPKYRWQQVMFEWAGVSAGTGLPPTSVRPSHLKRIPIRDADHIAVQIDTTHPNNTSTDIDVNVIALISGHKQAKWDTVPYAERNAGDGEVKSFLVEPGPEAITLELDNNDAGSTAYVIVRVFVRYVEYVLEEEEE